MKTKQFNKWAALLVATVLLTGAVPFADKQDEGCYFFIVVDGVWKNGTAYTSGILHYPGWESCHKYEDYRFEQKARDAFSDYLKAHHNRDFPYGENNNFQVIKYQKHSTSYILKNRSQAQERLTAWVAEQKEKDYNVVHTRFSYSCDNLE